MQHVDTALLPYCGHGLYKSEGAEVAAPSQHEGARSLLA